MLSWSAEKTAAMPRYSTCFTGACCARARRRMTTNSSTREPPCAETAGNWLSGRADCVASLHCSCVKHAQETCLFNCNGRAHAVTSV